MARSNAIADVVGKRYWREAEARVVVAAWHRSGKPVATFAREHGVEAARVSRWSGRLRAGAGSVRFHPVRLVGAARPEPRPEPLEVVLVDGRRLRLPAGFAVEDLRKVLDVLERREGC